MMGGVDPQDDDRRTNRTVSISYRYLSKLQAIADHERREPREQMAILLEQAIATWRPGKTIPPKALDEAVA